VTMLSTPPNTENVETLRDHPDIQPLIAGWYAGTVGRREFLTRATTVLGSLAAATTLLAACGGSVQTTTSAPATPTANNAVAPSRAAVAPAAASGSAVVPSTAGSAVASPSVAGSATTGTSAAAPATTGSVTAPVTSGSAAAPTATRPPASPATSGSAPAGVGSPTAAAAAPVATGVAEADVTAKMVQFKSGTANIIAYEARPKNATGMLPAVIVIHENTGLTEHIKDVTRRLAKEGFIGLGVDFLSRDGGTMSFNTPQDATGAINKLTDDQTIADSNAAIQYLTSNGATKVGVVGFCWGGRRSLADAENIPVSAAVVYYGPIAPPDNVATKDTLADAAKDMCPVLGNFGGLDPIIPAAKIQQLQQALQATGKTADFKIYPNAGHAFNNDTRPFNNNVGYIPDAAKDAWGRTIAWFKKYLA